MVPNIVIKYDNNSSKIAIAAKKEAMPGLFLFVFYVIIFSLKYNYILH